MKTATFIKDVSGDGFKGKASLYRMDPPLGDFAAYYGNDNPEYHEYVIASAVVTLQVGGEGPETYIFGASPDGEIINWSELQGSQKGTLDHVQAFASAGYEVVGKGNPS